MILHIASVAALSGKGLDPAHSFRIESALRGRFDWKRFLGLAFRQQYIPAAYRFFVDNEIENTLPTRVAEVMKSDYDRAQAMYMRNLAELIELIGELREIGIEPLVIKGAALAVQLYRDPGVRVSRDIDLLVDVGEIGNVGKLLEARGYSEYSGWISHEEYRKYHYHLVFTRGERRDRVVEIHWNLLNPTKGHPVVTGAVRESAKEIEIEGLRIKTLDDSHALWHVGVNFFYGGSFALRSLADLKGLGLRISESQWEDMIEFSRKQATYNELSTALSIGELALGKFVPDEVRHKVQPSLLIRGLLLPTLSARAVVWRWVPFKATHQLMVYFFLRRGVARKIRYLCRLLVPTRASLIETRAARVRPSRPTEVLKFHLTGLWMLCKVAGSICLLGFLVRSGLLGARRLTPEHHVKLGNPLGFDAPGVRKRRDEPLGDG